MYGKLQFRERLRQASTLFFLSSHLRSLLALQAHGTFFLLSPQSHSHPVSSSAASCSAAHLSQWQVNP